MKQLIALAEKVGATWAQVFFGTLIVGTTINASTAQAAAIGAIGATFTVLANAATAQVIPVGLPFWADMFLRGLKTYAAAFAAYVAAIPVFRLDWSIAIAANTAALPLALSLVKSMIASQFGDPQSAAMLPATLEPAVDANTNAYANVPVEGHPGNPIERVQR